MTSKLIGVKPVTPIKKEVPNLVTPEDWRQFITARVVWYMQRHKTMGSATLVHSSISPGTYSQEVADRTPGCCEPAVYTVECIFQVDPRDTLPLFLRVTTGALVLAPMAYDVDALTASVDKNTEMAIGVRAEALKAYGEDRIEELRRASN